MWEVMWSRFTVLTLHFSHRQVRDRLLVDLRPMWTSHRWLYRSSGLTKIEVHWSHLQRRVSPAVGVDEGLRGNADEGASVEEFEEAGLGTDMGDLGDSEEDGEEVMGFWVCSVGEVAAETGGETMPSNAFRAGRTRAELVDLKLVSGSVRRFESEGSSDFGDRAGEGDGCD